MADVGVFPFLPGLSWSITKAPVFQTRIQRAVSGRELRALDYPYPLWRFTLPYDVLRDKNDSRQSPSTFNELRTLMGFYAQCQGAYGTFLYNDLTDNQVKRQLLPSANSVVTAVAPGLLGTNYGVGQVVSLLGGVGAIVASFSVSSVNGSGGITALSLINPGSYSVVPGIANVPLVGGTGSGASVSVTWLTTVQLVRTLGDTSLVGGGFVENITAPNTVNAIYFNGIAQNLALVGWATNSQSGAVTIPLPFIYNQPVITADFTYYFRCRFVDDSYEFENFMLGLWVLKKLTFISVRP